MQTIEQRLDQWKNELLDLTNRNRLLSFNTSTSRTSSISLVAPESGELFRALIDGKPLLIAGNERDTTESIDEPLEPEIALALIGASDESSPRPSAPPKVSDTLLPPPIAPPVARPGTVLSAMSPEKTNKVAAWLFTQARASEHQHAVPGVGPPEVARETSVRRSPTAGNRIEGRLAACPAGAAAAEAGGTHA
jgi:hypothetical protein